MTPKRDTDFMNEALALAQQAAMQAEVPIGAVIVDGNGEIIGRGFNTVERSKSQLAHAEIEAIRQATKAKQDWRLDGCTLYVTLEPCRMCMGLIQLSRIDRIVYAASSPRFGFTDAASPIYKDVCIEKGIEADKAQRLLQEFFGRLRI